MRKSKFSESQIVGMLNEREASVPAAALLRRHGVSEATFFTPVAASLARRSSAVALPSFGMKCYIACDEIRRYRLWTSREL